MTRLRWWIALPALLVATSGPALAFDIRDKAGMFSAEAVRKAESELDRISDEYKVPVTIETVGTLEGDSINAVLKREAKKIDARGLYVLIAKKEHKIQAEVSPQYAKHLGGAREEAVYKSFEPGFMKGDFDAGLMAGVSKIDSVFSEAKAEAGGSIRSETPAVRPGARQAPRGGAAVPNKPSMGAGSLIWIVLGILGLLIFFRIIGAIFSAGRGGYANQGQMMGRGPGYGGPGYGGGYGGAPAGGGGFMSSMFGGIGGALAGNWLYDQFSGGRNHGASYDQSTVDPGVTGAPADPAGGDWVAPNETGGDWGGGSAPDAGGNWGGDAGGGGDWGGGGGGGDWGGGGDAGGGDGGSW